MENESLENFENTQIPEVPAQDLPSEEVPEAVPEQEAVSLEKEKPVKKPRSLFRDSRELVYILAFFMLIYVLCFRMVEVVGDSMNHTLVDGDRLLLVSNVFYRQPKQGDIIVASKDSFRNGECIIKRVIALEGQTVDIHFDTGEVYVDGELLEETYISSLTTDYEGMTFPLTVEEGCVFVMGDNRGDSMDSRHPSIGLIDEREILGKAILIVLPGWDETHERDYGRIGVIG